jgi:hypothetical protein
MDVRYMESNSVWKIVAISFFFAAKVILGGGRGKDKMTK